MTDWVAIASVLSVAVAVVIVVYLVVKVKKLMNESHSED